MPELPEVQTTVEGLNSLPKHLAIVDVWTDYGSAFHTGKGNIKDPGYFTHFKKEITGATITGAARRGKNILIHLSNEKTILIHMKMTGHLLYGRYVLKGKEWFTQEKDGPLADPFNRFIHLVFILSNGKHLAFSDMRKFAKVLVCDTKVLTHHPDLAHLGPEPLSKEFTYATFKKQILERPNGKIKQVLMDQTVIAGIGNIYSDEILWAADVHPASIVRKIPEISLKKIYTESKPILKKGIDFGGDSTSDYRNIHGERGTFQHAHNAYRRTKEPCKKRGCKGIIQRIVMGGRSAHFCNTHQVLYK